jgi:hypothetical protein
LIKQVSRLVNFPIFAPKNKFHHLSHFRHHCRIIIKTAVMKIRNVIIILLISTALLSCRYNPGEIRKPCSGPCPLYLVAPFIEVKIVDKTTNADLFLSRTSPYKFSDLSVTSSISGANVDVRADTTQTNNRFVAILSAASQTFILKLAALPADTINVVIKKDSPRCCPQPAINAITLNNNLICHPCSLNQLVTIKK